ncbi:MAG TPA: lipoprotein-releasing ABC transporter permease subunit [Rhizomicrobium sp.]|jgi:lipoprotein-releasing system permease protein|nr:lipoprotein-releasing ABC transporter permease subunit [Rhizomicrobium sp.]
MADRRANAGNLAARIGLATGGQQQAAPGTVPAATPAKPTPPFAAFEWMIALRYLRAKRKERFVSVISVISLVGIALGVATLIIVMSVMNGFRHELLSRILGLQGHVIVQGSSQGIPDFDRVVGRINAVPGVVHASPVVEGQVLASSGGRSVGALVRGLRRDDLKSLNLVSDHIMPQAALTNFGGGEGVIVGYRLAQKLGLSPGMNITLIAPQGDVTPFGTTPREKTYSVAGTFNIGMSEYDQTFIFMPLDEAQLYFNMGENAGDIQVMIDKPDNAKTVAMSVSTAAGPYTRTYSWEQMQSSLFGALQVERNVMFLILTLIILVAALNIISGLIMLVKDKSGDIAIMRTMGATRGAMMRIFLIAGASIGVFGTFFGFLIGVLFCSNIENIRQGLIRLTGDTNIFDPTIYFLSQMPAQMDTGEVTAVVIMSLALSLLATLYPSWRAARLDPVEALRYE